MSLLPTNEQTIKQLEAQLEGERIWLASVDKQNVELLEENKRLREALEGIVNSDTWFSEPNASVSSHDQAYDRCVMIAEYALDS